MSLKAATVFSKFIKGSTLTKPTVRNITDYGAEKRRGDMHPKSTNHIPDPFNVNNADYQPKDIEALQDPEHSEFDPYGYTEKKLSPGKSDAEDVITNKKPLNKPHKSNITAQ